VSIQVHTLHKSLKKDSEKSERMSEESEKNFVTNPCACHHVRRNKTHEKEAYANFCSTQAHDVFVFVFVFVFVLGVPT
jgi:hypothetical protein